MVKVVLRVDGGFVNGVKGEMEEGKRSFLDRKSLCGGGLVATSYLGLVSPGPLWLPSSCVLYAYSACNLPFPCHLLPALPATMWRDRISGQSTPSGANRNPSLPRRSSSQLSRDPYNNRPRAASRNSSTSLLLTPSDSTTSLPGTGRPSNGLGLRQTSAQRSRPAVVPDPLEVLNGIIGKEKQAKDIPQLSTLPDRPTELVEAINFDGLSLEEFVAKADPTPARKARGSDINAQTIQQFEQERDKFEELHTSITGCDDVSKSVELYLNDFQTELGAVSAEIETLQTRSTQLNAMLENRRNVEKLLGPAVEDISISPKAVRTIAEGPMDENWVRALNEIDGRTTSIEAKASSSNGFKAIEDVRPLLIDVKNKVSNGHEKALGCS